MTATDEENARRASYNDCLVFPNSALSLVEPLSDVEVAKALKAELVDAMGPALLVMAKIKKAGFTPSFAIGDDGLGRPMISTLTLARVF